MDSFKQRIPNISTENVRKVLQVRLEHLPKLLEMIGSEPDKLRQTRWSSLVSDYQSIGLCKYALGKPLPEVRAAFALATEAWEEVFRLRGTESPFPVVDVVLDPAFPPGDRRAVVSQQDRHPPGARDYSMTNSKHNLQAVCLGLTVGDFECAGRIASMAWDPPNATYIGPKSEICRPNDQHLAYAVKHLFVGEWDEALSEISQVSTAANDIRPREQAG